MIQWVIQFSSSSVSVTKSTIFPEVSPTKQAKGDSSQEPELHRWP